MQRLHYIFISKGSRTSVASLLSILTPIYLARLGYSALYVGVGLTAILAGNAFFNILLTWYGDYLGRKRSLLIFSLLVVVLLLVIYRRIGNIESQETGSKKIGLGNVRPEARRDITKLSFFYSIDAFGGSLVSQFVLSYWFNQVYKVSLSSLGEIFLAVNVVTAFSTLAAPVLAEKLGNLRTMVSTHLLSNVFLIMVPLAGSFLAAIGFLFLRQSISQMDVPTRQAFMAQLFTDEERVPANAVTNTSRSLSGTLGGPLTAVMFMAGASSLPILTGGFSKILYDVLVFRSYRKRGF